MVFKPCFSASRTKRGLGCEQWFLGQRDLFRNVNPIMLLHSLNLEQNCIPGVWLCVTHLSHCILPSSGQQTLQLPLQFQPPWLFPCALPGYSHVSFLWVPLKHLFSEKPSLNHKVSVLKGIFIEPGGAFSPLHEAQLKLLKNLVHLFP